MSLDVSSQDVPNPVAPAERIRQYRALLNGLTRFGVAQSCASRCRHYACLPCGGPRGRIAEYVWGASGGAPDGSLSFCATSGEGARRDISDAPWPPQAGATIVSGQPFAGMRGREQSDCPRVLTRWALAASGISRRRTRVVVEFSRAVGPLSAASLHGRARLILRSYAAGFRLSSPR